LIKTGINGTTPYLMTIIGLPVFSSNYNLPLWNGAEIRLNHNK